jgi:hypothetical protein
MEFFRELELVFEAENLTVDKNATAGPTLERTPLDGVATYSADIQSEPFFWQIKITRNKTFAYMLMGLGIITLLLWALSTEFLLILPAILLIGISVYYFSQKRIYLRAVLEVEVKGEAYQGKALGKEGERTSILSRGFLESYWCRSDQYPSIQTPEIFENDLADRLSRLDIAISVVLPEFSQEKTELPDTKS